MQILFKTGRLAKEFQSQKALIQRYGPQQAKLIGRRLDELRAAGALEDVRSLPGPRCHELKADRAGRLSVDLKHPDRLIFEPADNPVPRKPDGGLDWTQVATVRILEVTDTHG